MYIESCLNFSDTWKYSLLIFLCKMLSSLTKLKFLQIYSVAENILLAKPIHKKAKLFRSTET